MKKLLSKLDSTIRPHIPDVHWMNLALSHWDYWHNHGQPMRNGERFSDYVFSIKTNPASAGFGYFADKHLVKNLITAMIGKEYVIPTLYVSNTGGELEDFFHPDPYIVKPTHSSQHAIIAQGALTPEEVEKAKHWLKSTLFRFTREYPYRCLEPKIIIEPLISYQGKPPMDFKFFMSRGCCFLIEVDSDRFRGKARNKVKRDFYSPDWEMLDIQMRADNGEFLSKPAELPEMVSIAERLGSLFEFSRIDLYLSDDGIKFGEITLTPGSAHYEFDQPEVQGILYKELRIAGNHSLQ